MKNTENDYNNTSNYSRTMFEKTEQQRNMRQPYITSSAAAEEILTKILPIIDNSKRYPIIPKRSDYYQSDNSVTTDRMPPLPLAQYY